MGRNLALESRFKCSFETSGSAAGAGYVAGLSLILALDLRSVSQDGDTEDVHGAGEQSVNAAGSPVADSHPQPQGHLAFSTSRPRWRNWGRGHRASQ